jgi:hypothetical protein
MATYRKVLLTYLDILGFRELIRQSASNPSKVYEILNILKIAKRKGTTGMAAADYDGETKTITRAVNFSDLILRITYIDQVSELIVRLNMELMKLAGVQCQLIAQHGILLRGAISLGELYDNDDLIFGPALVNSYELEERTAVFPRIVIASDLVETAAEETAQVWPSVIRRGEDAAYFVDYLYAGAQSKPGGFMSTGFNLASSLVKGHQLMIEDKLVHTTGERARQKVLWTALYHNSVVDRLKAGQNTGLTNWTDLRIADEKIKVIS